MLKVIDFTFKISLGKNTQRTKRIFNKFIILSIYPLIYSIILILILIALLWKNEWPNVFWLTASSELMSGYTYNFNQLGQ